MRNNMWLITILLFIFSCFASWAVVSIFVYCLCALLGLSFSLKIATALWIIFTLVRSVFK